MPGNVGYFSCELRNKALVSGSELRFRDFRNSLARNIQTKLEMFFNVVSDRVGVIVVLFRVFYIYHSRHLANDRSSYFSAKAMTYCVKAT